MIITLHGIEITILTSWWPKKLMGSLKRDDTCSSKISRLPMTKMGITNKQYLKWTVLMWGIQLNIIPVQLVYNIKNPWQPWVNLKYSLEKKKKKRKKRQKKFPSPNRRNTSWKHKCTLMYPYTQKQKVDQLNSKDPITTNKYIWHIHEVFIFLAFMHSGQKYIWQVWTDVPLDY